MRKINLLLSWVLMGTLLFGVAACGGKGGHSSPEKAYKAMASAMKDGDYETAMSTYTKEGQNQAAKGMLMAGAFMMMKDEESKKKITEIMKKHGLDKDKAKTAAKSDSLPAIENKPAFIADMMNYMIEKRGKDPKAEQMAEGKLKEVKIDGKTAKGVVVTEKDGKESKRPIQFKKTEAGWKIHPGGRKGSKASRKKEDFFDDDELKPAADADQGSVQEAIHLGYEKPMGLGLFAKEGSLLYARLALRSQNFTESTSLKSLTLDKATTDAGKDLTFILNRPTGNIGQGFNTGAIPGTFKRDTLLRNGVDQSHRGSVLRVIMPFKAPGKDAKSVSLKGKATLMVGGEEKPVTIAGVGSMQKGDTLNNKGLKQAGLQVTLAEPVEGKSLVFRANGPIHLIKDYKLVDGKGNEVDVRSSSGSSSGGHLMRTITAAKKLPKDVGLQLVLVTNQSEKEVPFQFSNVALPAGKPQS